MKFLLMFIILACIGTTTFMFFYFDLKIKEYKRNILALNNQVYKLKTSCKKQQKVETNHLKEVSIHYRKSNFYYGITLAYTNVYLAPLNDSPIVNRIKDSIQVKIIYECELNKEIWYFIDLGLNTTVNCKGWIKKSQFSIFIDNQMPLPKGYR